MCARLTTAAPRSLCAIYSILCLLFSRSDCRNICQGLFQCNIVRRRRMRGRPLSLPFFVCAAALCVVSVLFIGCFMRSASRCILNILSPRFSLFAFLKSECPFDAVSFHVFLFWDVHSRVRIGADLIAEWIQ